MASSNANPPQASPLVNTLLVSSPMIFLLLVSQISAHAVSGAAVVAAQAVTVLAAPLTAWALIWLTNNKQIMGEDTNSRMTNGLAWGGFALLLAMAAYTAVAKVIPGVSKLLSDTA